MKAEKQPVPLKEIFLIVLLLTCTSVLSGCGSRTARQLQQQLELGSRYLREANYDGAVIAFRTVISIDPKCEEAYLGAAKAYAGNSHYQDASDILAKGIAAVGEKHSAELTAYMDSLQTAESSVPAAEEKQTEPAQTEPVQTEPAATSPPEDHANNADAKAFIEREKEGLETTLKNLQANSWEAVLADPQFVSLTQKLTEQPNAFPVFYPSGSGTGIELFRDDKGNVFVYCGGLDSGKRSGVGSISASLVTRRGFAYIYHFEGTFVNDLPEGRGTESEVNRSGRNHAEGNYIDGYADGTFTAHEVIEDGVYDYPASFSRGACIIGGEKFEDSYDVLFRNPDYIAEAPTGTVFGIKGIVADGYAPYDCCIMFPEDQ